MKNLRLILFIGFIFFIGNGYAQFGLRAGLNMANQIKSFKTADIVNGFSTDNLTGYNIGLVYQFMPKKSGLGAEIGVMVTQKGFTFSDSINFVDAVKTGYEEINYMEIPFNLRYRLKLGFAGIYANAGAYAGYALSATTNYDDNSEAQSFSFQSLSEHLDYGIQAGAGVELFNKIQLGANYSYGLSISKFSQALTGNNEAMKNSVFSILLTYIF